MRKCKEGAGSLLPEVRAFRDAVISEMRKLGASDTEIALLQDATIANALSMRREPEDVAWSLLQ